MRNIPDDEIPRMACPKKYLLKIKYRKDKSYLFQKFVNDAKVSRQKKYCCEKKIMNQLETSHKHSNGLI